MRDIEHAISQIEAIHEQLARSEPHRHFRAVPVLLAGTLGLVAAGGQGLVPWAASERGFVLYWVTVAALAVALGVLGLVFSHRANPSRVALEQTHRVVAQFLPTLAAGGLLAAASLGGVLPVASLPGLCSLIFGLGVLAAGPYLPRATRWVGIGYLATAAILLGMSSAGEIPPPWTMGLPFGLGQIASGFTLHRAAPRRSFPGGR